ncbi:MAG: CorA family magnesium transporter [Candidatus Peregrinibacteria bacterium]
MNAFRIAPDGTLEVREVSKRDLSERFRLHSRDLRPVLLLRQLSTISVRGDSVIVNLEELKMVVGKERAYILFSGHEKMTREFVELISDKIKTKGEDTHTPFEFLVLESAIFFTLERIEANFINFEKTLTKTLVDISDKPTEELFEKLLTLKKRISRLEKRVQEIQDSLEDLLEDNEEMAELRLSEGTEEIFPLENIESILDNALELAIEIANKISEKKEDIDDTQEILNLKMSSIRNTIIRLDLFTGVGTTILAFGTLITGFFGMNLRNYWELTEWGFFGVVGGTVFLLFLFFYFFYWFIKKKDMFSNW